MALQPPSLSLPNQAHLKPTPYRNTSCHQHQSNGCQQDPSPPTVHGNANAKSLAQPRQARQKWESRTIAKLNASPFEVLIGHNWYFCAIKLSASSLVTGETDGVNSLEALASGPCLVLQRLVHVAPNELVW